MSMSVAIFAAVVVLVPLPLPSLVTAGFLPQRQSLRAG